MIVCIYLRRGRTARQVRGVELEVAALDREPPMSPESERRNSLAHGLAQRDGGGENEWAYLWLWVLVDDEGPDEDLGSGAGRSCSLRSSPLVSAAPIQELQSVGEE